MTHCKPLITLLLTLTLLFTAQVQAQTCVMSTDCDDGDDLTQNICLDGECVFFYNDLPCTNDADCDDNDDCTEDICLEGENVCWHIGKPECFPIPECYGDADCNLSGDICLEGVCICEDGDCLNNGGACQQMPTNNLCDDDDPWTIHDQCSAGVCQGNAVECLGEEDCHDGNPCTDQDCVKGMCVYTFNTAPCDDDDPETKDDQCADGICLGIIKS